MAVANLSSNKTEPKFSVNDRTVYFEEIAGHDVIICRESQNRSILNISVNSLYC